MAVPSQRKVHLRFIAVWGFFLRNCKIQHVEEIDSVSGEVMIDGFVSLVGAHTKVLLFCNRIPPNLTDCFGQAYQFLCAKYISNIWYSSLIFALYRYQ